MRKQFGSVLIATTLVTSLLIVLIQFLTSPAEAWFGKSSCQKTKGSIVAEDKVYLLLQYAAIKDAKIYLKSKSSGDATTLQDAMITTIQAELTEYKLANGNSKCFSATQLAKIRLNITSDETLVAQTQALIANGEVNLNVATIVKLKPASLLQNIYG